jgi:hypothetical protein
MLFHSTLTDESDPFCLRTDFLNLEPAAESETETEEYVKIFLLETIMSANLHLKIAF